MTDATADFFHELGQRGHEPMLGKVSGTVRFDLLDGERTDHFRVALTNGDIAVSEENAEADCVLTTQRATFDDIASGETTLLVALLRGDLGVQGDVGMLVFFQRLFPVRQRASARNHATDTQGRRP